MPKGQVSSLWSQLPPCVSQVKLLPLQNRLKGGGLSGRQLIVMNGAGSFRQRGEGGHSVLTARLLVPPASLQQRSGAACALVPLTPRPRWRKSLTHRTGGNARDQEFLSGYSLHQLMLLTKHLASPLPPWQPLGCSLQCCLRPR